jgi:hypothetical protein
VKVQREQFLAAALALSAAAGCDLSAAIASRISPEKAEEVAVPAAQAEPASTESMERRGEPGSEGASSVGKGLASPTKEWGGPSPTKEAGRPSPTKEAGMPSPTKEWGGPSPTKEAGMPSPGLPSPTKEVL